MAEASTLELVKLQLHRNDWFVRHSRRLLQERHVAGEDLSVATESLQTIFNRNPDVTRRLRAMWSLYSIGAATEDWLVGQLNDPSEHIRCWAIRLLVDRGAPTAKTIERLTTHSANEASGLVRLSLASALQQLNIADRWQIARHLAQYDEDSDDRVQPLMLWYGIEAAIPTDLNRALDLAMATKIQSLRRYISRRLGSSIDTHPQDVEALIQQASQSDPTNAVDYLSGLAAALRGRHRITPPMNWQTASSVWAESSDADVVKLQRELSVVFGDGRAVDELLSIARDKGADPSARRNALSVVLKSQPNGLASTLLKLKSDKVVGALAIRGLAQFDDRQVGKQLLQFYRNAKHDHRPAIINTLASRESYATLLLDAVGAGSIEHSDIPATAASNIAAHQNPTLTAKLEKLWGAVQTSPQEKLDLIEKYRAQLTPERLADADLQNGRQVFVKACANCHKMFGEGNTIGPDLTGSNRDNLGYLLDNVIDPSRIVPAELQQSAVLLTDGRVMTGCITQNDAQTITIQTINEVHRVSREDIETIRKLSTSLMPDGILTPLSDLQVRDLFGFLQSTSGRSPQ